MAENKAASKDALSRALGAAFLSHRVEELEKTVSSTPNFGGTQDRTRRDRRGSQGNYDNPGRGRGGARQTRNPRPRSNEDDVKGRLSADRERGSDGEGKPTKKDADVVVLDASVLVHSLGQLKAWCRNNREEDIVVPLEALNTLDLLKKGTSPLAQRARAASRILEQQVGTNPRIKVQRDDAFVLWDEIPFANDVEGGIDVKSTAVTPEWLRRTICCARWEFVQLSPKAEDSNKDTPEDKATHEEQPAVRSIKVAVCLEPAQLPDTAPMSTSPVPLPAPHPSKYEQRCSGTLVTQWAKAAGLPIMECKPTPLPVPPSSLGHTNATSTRGGRHGRSSSEDERRGEGPGGGRGGGRRQFNTVRARNGPNDILGEKGSPSVYGPGRAGGALVERPAATMAMNASMMQPSKVIRVLARGEKLDP